jgi:hypothetical protein
LFGQRSPADVSKASIDKFVKARASRQLIDAGPRRLMYQHLRLG